MSSFQPIDWRKLIYLEARHSYGMGRRAPCKQGTLGMQRTRLKETIHLPLVLRQFLLYALDKYTIELALQQRPIHAHTSLRRFYYTLNQLELNDSREPVVAEKLSHG